MIQQVLKCHTIRNSLAAQRCFSSSTIALRTICQTAKKYINVPVEVLSCTPRTSSILYHHQIPQQHDVASSTMWLRSSFSTAAETPTAEEEPLLGVGKYKTSTGIVGLAVEPDWYNVMLKKFQALLDKMEASDMPETAQYRIDVTKWCNYVIATVKANPTNPEAVEDAVQMGQVEELIEMADDEMICLDTYLSSRMWELVVAANPPIIDLNPDPMRDPFGADGNTYEQDSIRKGMEQPQKP